jgi:hypothetical protein
MSVPPFYDNASKCFSFMCTSPNMAVGGRIRARRRWGTQGKTGSSGIEHVVLHVTSDDNTEVCVNSMGSNMSISYKHSVKHDALGEKKLQYVMFINFRDAYLRL